MKAVFNSFTNISLVSLSVLLQSNQVNAACSRDDVSFYLDKGFTTSQITTLCSEPVVPDVIKSESNMPSFDTAPMDEDALLLKRAIKAQKIDLNSELLQYTQKICIEYGEEDLFGFTAKACPDVTYSVSLKGLEILSAGKRFGFYGAPEIRVKSVIQRKIIGELKDQEPEDQALILDKFEKGNETAIPIRDDFSLEKVKQVLLNYSQQQ